MSDKKKIKEAVEIGLRYGQVDGDHHKLWVIDQMLRKLLGKDYDDAIAENTGEDDFEWDTGIAP